MLLRRSLDPICLFDFTFEIDYSTTRRVNYGGIILRSTGYSLVDSDDKRLTTPEYLCTLLVNLCY